MFEDRRFIDLWSQNAMDALDPGDVVMLPHPVLFDGYILNMQLSGLHVFMEKPVTADGFSSRKCELNEEAKNSTLQIGIGLMCRHSQARQELKSRIEDGELGEIINMRAYRMQAPIASCFSDKNHQKKVNLCAKSRGFAFSG